MKAKSRVMSGKPSQLGKQLINDLCKKSKKLDGCCCADIVWGMYRENLPVTIRNHIAEASFNKDTFHQIFATSDKVFDSNQSAQPVRGAAIAAVHPPQTPTDPNEVAAIAKPRRNKNNRNQGGNRNSNSRPPQNTSTSTSSSSTSSSSTSGNKGTRHATAKGDSDKLCKIHFRWGENGSYCAAPWKCPMKNVYKAPQ